MCGKKLAKDYIGLHGSPNLQSAPIYFALVRIQVAVTAHANECYENLIKGSSKGLE